MNELKYLDNQYIRSFSSNTYNFILDKETNVSVYWGCDQNDDPLYDPIGPQEITIKVTKDTTEQDIVNSASEEEKADTKLKTSLYRKLKDYSKKTA